MLKMSQLPYLMQSMLLYIDLMRNTAQPHCPMENTSPPPVENIASPLHHGEHVTPSLPHGEHVASSLSQAENIATSHGELVQPLCIM